MQPSRWYGCEDREGKWCYCTLVQNCRFLDDVTDTDALYFDSSGDDTEKVIQICGRSEEESCMVEI